MSHALASSSLCCCCCCCSPSSAVRRRQGLGSGRWQKASDSKKKKKRKKRKTDVVIVDADDDDVDADDGDGDVDDGRDVFEDGYSLVSCIKLCGKQKDLQRGIELHSAVLSRGLLRGDVYISNALISMYARCGMLLEAKKLLNEAPSRDVVTWNSLMSGYTRHGYGGEALECFKCMKKEGHLPDAFTFSCILKACAIVGSLDMGRMVHSEVKKQGLLLESNTVLGNALMDMYGKCGSISEARSVFDELLQPDTISWNVLISLYVHDGRDEDAMDCFAKMRLGGVAPDEFTFSCILKACGNMGSCEMGESIHAEICDRGAWFLTRNVALGNALVDMYANCGSIEKAERMLYEIPRRNVVSWSALIAGYAEHGLGDEALKCFFCMQEEGLIPNELTFASALKACGSIGSAEKGREMHARAKNSKKGSLERNPILSTALVDMYTKCGMLAEAREVFDGLLVRDVVSWNALLMGYAQLGDLEAVVLSYNAMLEEDGIKPNRVTFLVMLTMCSHAGLVCEGQMYFDVMGDVYGIEPTLEHHACMVDLFGRAGHFDKAMDWIGKLDPSDRLQLWMALLGACRKWANVELGRRAFESVLAIDPKLATVYVSMRNIYLDAGMHAEAKEIEALGVENGAWEECVVGAVV